MENNIDLSGDREALLRIDEAAKEAIIELKSTDETDINLPFIFVDENGPMHLSLTVTKDWDNTRNFDTEDFLFQKHKVEKKKRSNHRFTFLTLAILIIVFSTVLIFFLL